MSTLAILFNFLMMMVFFNRPISSYGKDYCTISCGGLDHIGCKNNGEINTNCTRFSTFHDLSFMQNEILDRHNKYRNQIALGEIRGYEPAKRMPTMQWDDELAYLAGLNVKTCNFGHDRCRNTESYSYSGQNLFWYGATGPNIAEMEINENLLSGIDSWFDEYKNTNMGNIKSYGSVRSLKPFGHFTVMVSDLNIRVGCAALKKKKGSNSVELTMACNYATTNISKYPIYVNGRTASKCTKGPNPNYPGLCHPSEQVNPNNVNRK